MRKTVRACCVLCCLLTLSLLSQAQDIEPKYKTADTNNAVIHGRVVLPSGFAAERFFRVTLRNTQSTLMTTYTNKSGEFQIRNLSEGTYYVQVDAPDETYEPATRRIELGRGLFADITLELREKKDPAASRLSARVVSAAELRQAIPPAAKKQYEQGLKFVAKGDYSQAATCFEGALALYPEYIAARNDLGAQYLKLKRVDEAEKHFQIVLGNDPKNFNATFNMGLVQVERRDYLGAIATLNQAISIDSSRPVARLWIGIAKLEMGNTAEAEPELTKSLIMGGAECVAAHYHLARIYAARGDFSEAAKALRSYLDEAPRGEFVKEAKQLQQQIEKRK